MELSSPRYKAIAVTLGFSFWFFIIMTAVGLFSLEAFGIFVAIVFILTQYFSVKLSKGLELFAKLNNTVLLGTMFIFVIAIYGILFRAFRIDLLRLKKQPDSYWLDMEQFKESDIFKQY